MGLRALGVLLLLGVSGCDQSSPLQTGASQRDLISALDEQAIPILESAPASSLAVAVVRGGKVEFARLYDRGAKGQNVVGAQEPIFEAASLGKPVFAYLVMKMVELDILSLERPLAHYEPELVTGADLRLDGITARMVLSHTSGLSRFEEGQPLKLSFDPGTSFVYSGWGTLCFSRFWNGKPACHWRLWLASMCLSLSECPPPASSGSAPTTTASGLVLTKRASNWL